MQLRTLSVVVNIQSYLVSISLLKLLVKTPFSPPMILKCLSIPRFLASLSSKLNIDRLLLKRSVI